MVISINPEMEKAVREQAERTGKSPEEVVNEALRRGLLPNERSQQPPSRNEFERLLKSIPIAAGVSLTDEQVSRESIYED